MQSQMSAQSIVMFRAFDLPAVHWLQQHPDVHVRRQHYHKSCHVLLRRSRQPASCSHSSIRSGRIHSSSISRTSSQMSTTFGFVSIPVSSLPGCKDFPRRKPKQLCCVISPATMISPEHTTRAESSVEHPQSPPQSAVNEQEQQQHHQMQQALVLPQAPQQSQQLQQPQQPVDSSSAVDPSTLSITARVRLLTSNAAARRHSNSTQKTVRNGMPVTALQACAGAGISTAASAAVLMQVKAMKVSRSPEALSSFLAAFKRLADRYGEAIAMEWLRKAPSVIRVDCEVPGRLAQLQQLLGPDATFADVLALTKRCPQVLQVNSDLMAQRMQQLCSLLGKDQAEAAKLLTAAPALMAMQPDTLRIKAQQLQALAATHASWSSAFSSCPSKSLAVLLTYSLERQLRLHFAAAHGLQPKIHMTTVMAWSKCDWLKAHPTYETWCQLYKRQQQQPQQQQPVPDQQQSQL